MKSITMIIVSLAMVGLSGNVSAGIFTWYHRKISRSHSITIYKSPTCYCCGIYISYLRSKNYTVKVINLNNEELQKKKTALGVPQALDSCHTTVTEGGNYFAEGHIPYEALSKLLAEKPPIRGIGLAGMPSASPGMPGSKEGPFLIKQVAKDGKISLYLSM